ncbi:hypothetical protein H1Q63_32565 [Desmonostoc muscorum CCALA 125]|nr:hypothetical protein [Desmonostoc muscorum CCALA 125]
MTIPSKFGDGGSEGDEGDGGVWGVWGELGEYKKVSHTFQCLMPILF